MKAAVLALLLTTAPVSAATYQWTWNGSISGSGTLTTAPPTNHVGFTSQGTFEVVTSISGQIGNLTIYGMWPQPDLIVTDRLFATEPFLVDDQGIHLLIGSSSAVYEASLNGCWWTTEICFHLGGQEVYPTHTSTLNLSGTFAVVPGPIVGAGLPGLLLAGASLFTFLRRKRN